LRISIAELPVLAESNNSGLLIDLVNLLIIYFPDTKITYEIVPFTRSIELVRTGNSDVQLPIIDTDNEKRLKLSEKTIFNVQFSIFSRQDHPISKSQLLGEEQNNSLVVETDLAHICYFGKKLKATTCLECSVKKLSLGRIDGLLFASTEVNYLINSLNINNLKQTPFAEYSVKFGVSRSEKGKKNELLFANMLTQLEKNPTYISIIRKLELRIK
jgi:polar amino acid transport system substrate-binding protein